jgi:hexulose-6-phosphate isomerase
MNSHLSRRNLLAAGVASVAALGASTMAEAAPPIILPPKKRSLLLGVKLTMITKEENGKKLSLTDRLKLAGQAGFDGVDLDDAAPYTPEQARDAVIESGVFVHGAINHAHWDKRLTSAKAEERAKGLANLEHCIRVSHAAGGSGVLLVIGHANDGTPEETAERARQEMKKALPLAAALGQKILVENVWNSMFYKHGAPPEQTPEEFVKFVDSFNSPWVGMYYDIGNHWKYGQPSDWIHAFGHRCVKLDIKGFSRAQDKFVDIPDGDLPWKQVQKALADISYNGWATAEVGGGGLERLTTIRKQMEQAFGL